MSASLLGKTPGTPDNSYQWLLHAGAAGPLTGTARAFTLGDGSATPLSMTSSAIVVKGLTVMGGASGTIPSIIDASQLTATRTHTLPDQSGTLATIDDLHEAVTVTGNGLSLTGQQLNLVFGTTAGTVCAGDDDRLGGGGPHTHDYTDIAKQNDTHLLTIGGLVTGVWHIDDTHGTYLIPASYGLWNGNIDVGTPASGAVLVIQNHSDQVAYMWDGATAVGSISPGLAARITGNGTAWSGETLTDHPVLRSEMDAEFVNKGFSAPVVPENSSFTMTAAKHANKWTRLTATTGTTTITLTTSPPEGTFFPLYRAGAGLVAFSGGTVNGVSRLPTIGVNMGFGLVHTSTPGTYDFV